MWANIQFLADLVTFTEEVLNRNLYVLAQWMRGNIYPVGMFHEVSNKF